MIGQRLARDGEAADVGDGIGADAQVEEAGIAEPRDEVAAGGVDVGVVMGGEVGPCPRVEPRGEVAVARLVEGPVEAHQSPLNSGFSFAAKAS